MGKISRIPTLLLVVLATVQAQSVGPSGNTCPDTCPVNGRPVCGTNNILYRNECTLLKASCVNSSIRKKNDGPCITPNTDSECQRNCPTGYQPVCATNGRTYNNRCHLAVANCQNSNIRLRYEGVCDVSSGSSSSNSNPASTGTSSSSSSSSSGAQPRPSVGDIVIGAPVRPQIGAPVRPNLQNTNPAPVVNTPRPVRNCPDECNPGFRPVCGSDGLVYGSQCKLNVAICKNPSLRKKNDGVCEKDCTIQCPVEISYVCGTDGKTYVNDCELTVARCKDPAIRKAGDGRCTVLRDTECDVGQCERVFAPVCGSDGQTYENFCRLKQQQCTDHSLLKIQDGECSAQRCNVLCAEVFEPVCGSNGVSYPNHCTLINAACRERSGFVKVADGPCPPRRNS